MAENKESSKGRLFGLLRIGVALVILGWIATQLPWSDRLEYRTPAGTVSVKGEINGDWKVDRVGFRPDSTELDSGWPQALRDAAAAGEEFDVERRRGAADGYEWQPSFTRALSNMHRPTLFKAMLLFIGATFLISTRWWRLLKISGCPTSWFNAFRLTYVGFCFNLVMPGMTGGDVVKGVIAAKENPTRRADAIVSVVVDRVIGLAALAVLAVIVIFVSGREEFGALRKPLLALIGAGLLGAALYAYKPLRKKLGISALVDRLPLGDKLRSLDEAALVFLRHPRELTFATMLSFGNHLTVCLGVYYLARAIGIDSDQAGMQEFFVLAPIANIVGAIPLAPGGWGLGEAAYRELFELIGLSGALGVAVSVTFRLCILVGLGLIGSLFLLLPGVRADARVANDQL